MSVPLRKTTNGYNRYGAQRQPAGKPKPGRAANQAPRRLVRRQIRSNAEFRRAIAWSLLGITSVLFLLGILSIFVKAGVSQLNYSINSIQTENGQILLDNEKTRGQIAELRSLDRIEEIARLDLGMEKNERIEYMVLSSTITAEGKVRITEEEPTKGNIPEEERSTYNAISRALDFILAILNK